jgi:hypothetical protein
MNASDPTVSVASRVFEFAKQFVVLRFRAERRWFSPPEDVDGEMTDIAGVGLEERLMREAALTLADEITLKAAAKPLKALATTVQKFWSEYQLAWDAPERVARFESEHLRDYHVEFPYECEFYMFQGSPLQDARRDKVQTAMTGVLDSLEPEMKACCEPGILLGVRFAQRSPAASKRETPTTSSFICDAAYFPRSGGCWRY